MTRTETFFYNHAGYCYDPTTETVQQGRERCAKVLAAAAIYAAEEGWYFEWERTSEQYGWHGEKGGPDECFGIITKPGFKGKRYCGFVVTLRDQNGKTLDVLGGITFKKNDWHSDPYRRVVEAELALNSMPEKVTE